MARYVSSRRAPKARSRYMRGRGSYTDAIKNFATTDWAGKYRAAVPLHYRQAIGTVARAVGNNSHRFGAYAPLATGIGALGQLSQYYGTGKYTRRGVTGSTRNVVNNALVGRGMATAGIPTFGPHQSEYRIQKTEFLQSIYAPTTSGEFANTIIPINPGLQESFPWLGLVAAQFEEYQMVQLMYHWRPMVTDFNSGTGQCGEIILVTQYNPSDPVFVDPTRAKSYDGAMSSKTAQSMNHGVECKPKLNSGAPGKYIRIGPLKQGQDLKQYDIGNLNLIVTGTPTQYDGQLLGELWCSYTVTLRKPKLPDTTGQTILRDFFTIQPSTTTVVGDQYSAATLPLQKVLYGQQNRINDIGTGLVLTPIDDNSFKVTYFVPYWYTGNLRVEVDMLGCFKPANQNKPNIPATTSYTSNVKPVSDQLAWYNTGDKVVWSNTLQAPGEGQTIPAAYSYTNDVRVQMSYYVSQSTSNSPTSISVICYLPFNAVGVTLPCRCRGLTVDVSEYNDYFNTPGGPIQLVDANNTTVTLPVQTL